MAARKEQSEPAAKASVNLDELRELIAFNAAHPGRMLRYGQALLVAAEATSTRAPQSSTM